jgi:DNA-binding XRE family transcriptional regulator
MDRAEFKQFRKRLNKTQTQMAQLLGVSLKAVHSYEQGWRRVPPAVERQIYFLAAKQNTRKGKNRPCWQIKKCASEQRARCPAWEFGAGELCWFINGTICDGTVQQDWKEKMKICRTCEVFEPLLR